MTLRSEVFSVSRFCVNVVPFDSSLTWRLLDLRMFILYFILSLLGNYALVCIDRENCIADTNRVSQRVIARIRISL